MRSIWIAVTGLFRRPGVKVFFQSWGCVALAVAVVSTPLLGVAALRESPRVGWFEFTKAVLVLQIPLGSIFLVIGFFAMAMQASDAVGFPRRVDKFLLSWAAVAWMCYLLSFVPFRSVDSLLRIMEGFFLIVVAFPSSLGVVVAGVWAGLRVRRWACFAAAGAAVPLVPLVLYRMVSIH